MTTKEDLELHYNDEARMYEHFLGPAMAYTCADFEGLPAGATLEQGQKNKFEKLIRFAGINEQTKRVLDLGCSWWGIATIYLFKFSRY